VYVFEGAAEAVEPDDICVKDDLLICPEAYRPLLEAAVEFNESSGLYDYRTGFMKPDVVYTVALLCTQDDPEQDDNVSFIGETEVLPIAGPEGTGPVDFDLEDVVALQPAP
jgi:hypothetical protein